MKKIIYGVFLVGLVGCASAETIQGPDGLENQLIHCGGGIKNCYEKATEVCGGKYKIVNSSTEVSGGREGTGSTNDLLVKCGN